MAGEWPPSDQPVGMYVKVRLDYSRVEKSPKVISTTLYGPCDEKKKKKISKHEPESEPASNIPLMCPSSLRDRLWPRSGT